MRSEHLRRLDGRLRILRKRYLPRRFSATANYSEEIYVSASAFILLMHSELETYFEQFALYLQGKLLNDLAASRTTVATEAALLIYCNQQSPGGPSAISEIRAEPWRLRQIQSAAHKIRMKIEANKGIKTSNILGIFMPLGLDEGLVDQALLTDLDDFCHLRGSVAHHAIHDIAILPDPKQAREMAIRIVESLKQFELQLA